jgi:hypothetical protein
VNLCKQKQAQHICFGEKLSHPYTTILEINPEHDGLFVYPQTGRYCLDRDFSYYYIDKRFAGSYNEVHQDRRRVNYHSLVSVGIKDRYGKDPYFRLNPHCNDDILKIF